MRILKYIRENGLKHTMDVLWKYKMDKLIQYFLLVIYKNKPLKSIIILESHNDFDSNGGALYDYLIEHGYNKEYKVVWLIRNQKPENLPQNVECFSIFRPSIKKDYYLVNAKYKATCHEVTGSLRDGQISYYMTHGPVGLKCFKGKVTLPPNLTYCLCSSEFMAPILADQYGIDYPNAKQIILGFPCHDVFYSAKGGDLNKLVDKKYNKVILWMPTFRVNYDHSRRDSTSKFNLGIPIFKNNEELDTLNRLLIEKHSLLIIKIHPMQDLTTIKVEMKSNIVLLDGKSVKKLNIDNYRLMKNTDALISDYSSAAYDYLHLDKPIAYTMDDANNYKLGFIVENPRTLMAGNVIYDIDDYYSFVNDILNGVDNYKEERKELFNKVFKYHDGNSCKRLVEFMNL